MLNNNQISSVIIEICKILKQNGFQAYIVGGSIRDLLMGNKIPSDWDLATDAKPESLISIFKENFRVIPTGLQHGTITITHNNISVEITTYRIEGKYVDGRRPEKVQFVKSIDEDLARRDLTINAIAYDPIAKKIIDPFDGIKDIRNNILKMVGNPNERLAEDGLRVIRVFRFVAQLGFQIDEKTLESIPLNYQTFRKVAKERVHSELSKLLSGPFFQKAIIEFIDSGFLFEIIPEYQHRNFQEKIPNLKLNRIEIIAEIFKKLPKDSSYRLRTSVLFHQLSASKGLFEKIYPQIDEKLITKTMKFLKFSNKEINDVLHILKIHLLRFPYSTQHLEEQKDYLLRIFLYKVSKEYLSDYLDFLKAKMSLMPSSFSPISDHLIIDLKNRATRISPIYLQDLKINGDDIISYFELDKSIRSEREFIGLVLEILRQRIECEPLLNQKIELQNMLGDIKRVFTLCKATITRPVRIVSTDHVRKSYRGNKPSYSKWESTHTYNLAIWVMLCILRKNEKNIVIFDATNFNFPNHPNHRSNIGRRFNNFNPIYIHTEASDEEVNLNMAARSREENSIRKSDADVSIYEKFKNHLVKYPNALETPKDYELIFLNTRSSDFEIKIESIGKKILKNNNRFIIMSGNVLTGKTYASLELQSIIEKLYKKRT